MKIIFNNFCNPVIWAISPYPHYLTCIFQLKNIHLPSSHMFPCSATFEIMSLAAGYCLIIVLSWLQRHLASIGSLKLCASFWGVFLTGRNQLPEERQVCIPLLQNSWAFAASSFFLHTLNIMTQKCTSIWYICSREPQIGIYA